ncbi:efflux RND transporter periplasmic adaptor subunit [Ferriphaselus amnicola]|uniref:efflux RND transporter periplasmic adaptor subunit n=1 Tax=Ferriphaselus amnicola TaxID=1188319 RepID=UPI000787AECF|nr:efflux RND transporter periplasmic adaptor subunit [Ferriphaselus amnicola]
MRCRHKVLSGLKSLNLSKRKISLLALAAALVSAFLWVILTQGPLAPLKVTTDRVRAANLAPEVFGVGIIEARHTYNIAPIMNGRVSRMLVDQGDKVVAGQVVAEIDPVDLNEKLASSQHLAERAANTIKVAEAQLIEAQSRSRTTSSTYARFEELHTRGFVSQEMLDAKLHERTAAIAAVEAATASLSAAKREYAKSLSDFKGAKKQQEQTRLISPVSGIVTARMADNGAILSPGQTALQVVEPSDLWIKTRVDQKQAGMLQPGCKAVIVLRSQPQIHIPGALARIDLISDSVTEERIVNVVFSTKEIHPSVGEYAEITFQLPSLQRVLSIPSAAVKRISQQEVVWVLQEGHARLRAIKTGVATLDGRTQVIDGLSDQDEVIVYSQQALRNGLKVKVVSEIVRN